MMQNLSMIECENEVLRDRYRKLRIAAKTLANEVERSIAPGPGRELIFKTIEDIKIITK